MPTEGKRLLERTGGELRERIRHLRGEGRQDAIAELERRRGNLRGAVVPAWELEARGENVDEWELW
jgi:hypothetical protein